MSALSSKLTQALFPLLTATLLATACSDSTAPSTGEGAAGDSPARLPTDTGGISARSADQMPTPEIADAPKVNWPAPGNTTTSSLRPSSLTQRISPPNQWAPGPGYVRVPTPVVCWGAHAGRSVVLGGMVVGRTGGRSNYFDQNVRAKFWFYRWNGSTWAFQAVATANVSLRAYNPPLLPVLEAALPTATYRPTAAGYYKVMVQLAWSANINGSQVQTAASNVYFDAVSDYLGAFGGTSGEGGFCGVL